jgi:ferredoxin
MKVYDKEEGKVIVKKPSECIACRACEVQCPEKAIGIIDKKEEKRVDEEIKEVIKKERYFEPRAKKIIMNLHKMLLQHGFAYKGFAWDFKDVGNSKKNYKTVSIIYEHPSREASCHIVYDNNFWLPFIIRKDFKNIEENAKPFAYKRNPVRLLVNELAGKRFSKIYEIDDRTQRLARITIKEPDKTLNGIYGAEQIKNTYESYRRMFKKK